MKDVFFLFTFFEATRTTITRKQIFSDFTLCWWFDCVHRFCLCYTQWFITYTYIPFQTGIMFLLVFIVGYSGWLQSLANFTLVRELSVERQTLTYKLKFFPIFYQVVLRIL